jgi:hypothetical protein
MTPGKLAKAVSIALDVPLETITQHDRTLAIAGLRTMGARGRHAPHATPLDAARLVVATLGSVRVKDSVETVREFERAKFHRRMSPLEEAASLARSVTNAEQKKAAERISAQIEASGLKELKESEPLDPAIEALPQTHNFIECVAALISDASSPVEDIEWHLQRYAEMVITCGSHLASIRYARGWRVAEYKRPPRKASTKKPERDEPDYRTYARFYGVSQERMAFGSAIILLGKAFRDNGLPFETTVDALNAMLANKAPAKSKKAT